MPWRTQTVTCGSRGSAKPDSPPASLRSVLLATGPDGGLSAPDVEIALAYWADYSDEIDELIRRHQASQDEALAAWERRRALDAI
jgi:hypothetical protein